MAWMIVSDSSCEIRELKNPAPGVQFALVPFKIRVGEREYVDLATLNTQQMLQAMTDYNGASTTACPSPEEWAEYFLQADNVFALTISSNLSGSYNAAMAAREMVLEEHPEKKIFVLDTLSCSGALAGAAELANKLIGEDQTFDDICFALKKFADSTHILFALGSRFYRRPPEHARSGPPHAGRQDRLLLQDTRRDPRAGKDPGADGRGQIRWCPSGAHQRVRQSERRPAFASRH